MLEIHDFEAFRRIETPFYWYDVELLRRTLHVAAAQAQRYGVRMHYALKANSEPRIVDAIAAAGFGAECVSGNEVQFALRHGFRPADIFFDGVCKTDPEIREALAAGIAAFNVESLPELERLNELAREAGVTATVQLRINPDVDAGTHKYITTGLNDNKFGISSYSFTEVLALLERCESVRCSGLQFHIGSQITDVQNVVRKECLKINEVVAWFEREGLVVDNIDLGGGLGIDYDNPDEMPVPDFATWLRTATETLDRGRGRTIHVEPGRSLVGQCGSLVSRVVFVKKGERKNFLILDAGMNNLIRPALYGAYHKIENLSASYERGREEKDCAYDIVGPICESTDTWGENRVLRQSGRGDLVAIRSAGAYGSVMASTYNMRTPAPAVFSDEFAEK